MFYDGNAVRYYPGMRAKVRYRLASRAARSRLFLDAFWVAFAGTVRRARIAAIALTLLIAYLVIVAWRGSVLGLSESTVVAVGGAIFGSAIFLAIEAAVSAVSRAADAADQELAGRLVARAGIRDIYLQRGDDDASVSYGQLIRAARERVWAVGMTNHKFTEQHLSQVLTKDQAHFDAVVAFMDPNAVILKNGVPQNMLEMQLVLEGKGTSSQQVKDRQRRIEGDCTAMPFGGRLRILNLRYPTQFSCLVIDDDVFFFPFLAGRESSDDPIVRCSSRHGLGEKIVRHCAEVFSTQTVCETVFDSTVINNELQH